MTIARSFLRNLGEKVCAAPCIRPKSKITRAGFTCAPNVDIMNVTLEVLICACCKGFWLRCWLLRWR